MNRYWRWYSWSTYGSSAEYVTGHRTLRSTSILSLRVVICNVPFIIFKVHAHTNFQNLERLLVTMSNTKNEPIHSSDLLATLQYSQQAPILLGRQSNSKMAPLSLITSAPAQPEEYATIERLFFTCLQTGDDKSALICLDKLTQFFGPSNERIMGLHGLYEEAIAGDNLSLEKCLQEYDDILQQNPVNLVCLPPPQFWSLHFNNGFCLLRRRG